MKSGDQIERRATVELFNTVFEQDVMGMAIRAIDPNNSRWVRVNQKFCDMLGYTRAELLQLTSVDISLPDERDLSIEYNEQLLRGELRSYSREKRFLRKDGTLIWTNIWLSAVPNPDGNPTQIISVIQEVTQQKLAEEALLEAHDLLEQRVKERTIELRESEKLFKQAAEIASLGHFEWDELADLCLFASDEYARILGLTIGDVLTQYNTHAKDIMLVHPDDRDRVLASYAEFRNLGGSLDIEYRIIRPDGEERHIREMGDPVFDDQGRLIRNVGILQDFTKRGEMQKSLEHSEAKLKLVAQTAKLGYWRFDEVANKYLEVSEEFALIFGYTAEEYLKRFKSLDDDMKLVHPHDRIAVYEAYESGTGEEIEYRVYRRDGSIAFVREISKHIEDDDGNLIEAIGTLQDITELKEAELEAERASHAKS